MKIGIISGEFPPMPGGVGHFTRILARRMQAQGHAVRLLSRTGSTCDDLEITGIPGWGLKHVAQIQTWAKDNDFDIINLQFQTAAFDMSPWIHFLPAMLDAPLVTTFHDLRHPYLFPKAGPLRDWTVRQLASSADGLIVTNPEDDNRLAQVSQRALIPIGSNILREAASEQASIVAKARWREGLADATTLIGHFGFLQASKGIDNLLDALAQLRAEGQDARLLFIGGQDNAVHASANASYRESLAGRIKQLGLEEAISWTGYLQEADVSACLQALDIVALPYLDGASYRRGSLMAAIHHGCAILTTQPTVKHETFVHGENLWLVDRQSAAAIHAALLHLIQNPQVRSHISAGAMELRQHFDWDIITSDTLAFYEETLRAAGRGAAREDV